MSKSLRVAFPPAEPVKHEVLPLLEGEGPRLPWGTCPARALFHTDGKDSLQSALRSASADGVLHAVANGIL